MDVNFKIMRLLAEMAETEEEIEEIIEFAIEELGKRAVRGQITMRGIVAYLKKLGLKNKPEYRKKAVSMAKDMGLSIGT